MKNFEKVFESLPPPLLSVDMFFSLWHNMSTVHVIHITDGCEPIL